MSVPISSIKKIKPSDHVVYLADINHLDWLANEFSKEEQDFIKKLADSDTPHVILPRAGHTVAVQFLKHFEEESKDREKARKEGNEFLDSLKKHQISQIVVVNKSPCNRSIDFVEGLALGNYQFLKYYKDAKKKKSPLRKIAISSDSATPTQIRHLNIAVESTCIARDLINEPLSFLTAVQLSKQIKSLGKKAGFKVEVFDKKKIQSLKMGGLLAVNLGSFDPPTFSIMEWKPAKAKNKKPVVLVGKGVVYDTGGLSLKPTAHSMDFMKSDMGGAAVVIGTMHAIAKAKLPIHVIALVPATDNRPGNRAYVPGDVIKMFSGSTVEVLNTDAEGRMLLADALHFAKKLNPELVMDFATLTGAAARSVGGTGIVCMGNADEKIKTKVKDSGYRVYERLVEFPMWEEYGEMLKSDIADLKNIGGPYAGAITAGKFLEHFTDYPWMHFDIAGSAYYHQSDSYRGKNGTGVGVRLMFDFLKNY